MTVRNRAGLGLGMAAMVAAFVVACGKGDDEVSRNEATQGTVAMAPETGSRVANTSNTTPGEVTAKPAPPTTEVTRTIPDNVTYADAESVYTMGNYSEAKELFGAYVERKPENAFGHYMLGLSAWKSGDLETAVSALEKSHSLSPEHVKTVLNLSRVLLDDGKPEDALVYSKKALDLDPENGDVYRVLGNVYSDLSQPDSAEGVYRVALTKDTQDAWTMNNLGLLLIREGRYEEALPPLAKAVELRPEVPVFQNNLGVALEKTGHPYEAAEAFRAAVGTGSGHGKAEVSLARIEEIAERVGPKPIDLTELAKKFEDELVGGGVPETGETEQDEAGKDGQSGGVVHSGDKGGSGEGK